MDVDDPRGEADGLDAAADRAAAVAAAGDATTGEDVAVPGFASRRVGIARGVAVGFVADVVVAVSSLVVSIGVTRFLLPTGRGIYFLALFTATLIALLGDLGATIASLTYGANGKIVAETLHGLALAVTGFATAVGGAILIGAYPFWEAHLLKGVTRFELVLAAIGIAPVLYAQICGGLLTGLGRIPVLSAARLGSAIVTPAVTIPVVWATGSPRWAVLAWLVCAFLFAAALGATLLFGDVPPRRPSRREARQLLGFGLRGQIGTISHQGFLRLDVLFLNARTGPAVVGWYSLASVIAEKLSLVIGAVYGASVAPIGEASLEGAAVLVARLLRTMLLLLVPVGLLLVLVAHPLVVGVFGQNYSPAVKPLRILVPGAICLVLWYLITLYIVVALKRPGTATVIQIVGFAASIPLYWFGIARYQMTGAAAASTLVYAFVFAAGLGVLIRTSQLPLSQLRPARSDAADLAQLLQRVFGRLTARQPRGSG